MFLGSHFQTGLSRALVFQGSSSNLATGVSPPCVKLCQKIPLSRKTCLPLSPNKVPEAQGSWFTVMSLLSKLN